MRHAILVLVPCITINQFYGGTLLMTSNTQLNKGVLEGCVMKLVKTEYLCPSEIVEAMRTAGFTEFSEGTLYPMLLRMEKEGCFETMRQITRNSPPKKYYKLSENGRERLKHFYLMWTATAQNVAKIFDNEE